MTKQEQDRVFTIWMQKHRGAVSRIARAYSPLSGEYDDLLQEIMLAVWQSVPSFRADSRVSTYVYRIALNRAISLYRSRGNKLKRERALDESRVADQGVNAADDERLDLVYEEIRRLDEVSRAAVLMQLEGYSYREIGRTLGITESNVGVRLNRARRTLMDNLRDQ